MAKVKKALITGITGQDGSYLTEILLEKGYEVHGIVRRCGTLNTDRIDHLCNNSKIFNKSLFLHYGDLSSGSDASQLVSLVKPDEVYNLGSQSDIKVSFDIPEYTANVDGLGALRLLTAIKDYCPKARYYQASTSDLYGGIPAEMPKSGYNEESAFHPRSPYAVAKLFAYWTTRTFRDSYGIHASNGILFNHESPRRSKTFVTRKITSWIGANVHYLKNSNIVLPLTLGNLNARRDWSHAKDCCEAMYLMLQNDSPDDYVISSGTCRTVRAFAEAAFLSAGMELKWSGKGVKEQGYVNLYGVDQIVITIDPKYYRCSEVHQLKGDSSKVFNSLGWKPAHSFESLVDEMVKSDSDNPHDKRF